VQRAVSQAEDYLQKGITLWANGYLAHNTQLMEALQAKGLSITDDLNALEDNSAFIIRAHGAPPAEWASLSSLQASRGLLLVDATCPCVKNVFQLAKSYSDKGYKVVILGQHGHPEVESARAWAGDSGYVTENCDEVEHLQFNPDESVVFLAQTTMKQSIFCSISSRLRRDFPNGVVLDTICSATRLRQESAEELAGRVDLMIVIGGLHSANTRHLYELCKSVNPNTIWIETANDLQGSSPDASQRFLLSGNLSVGITAGASTPEWIIEEVEAKVTEWEKKQEASEEQVDDQEGKQEEKSPEVEPDQPCTETQCKEECKDEGEVIGEEEAVIEPEDTPPECEDEDSDKATECEEEPQECASVEDAPCDEDASEAVEVLIDESSDESSAEALEAALEMGAFDLPRHSFGDIIKATVVKIQSDEVMVDVGLKSEGVIPRRELSIDSSLAADEVVSVGDEIEVFVLRSEDQEGRMTFSKRRADQAKHWETVLLSFENEEIIEGKITELTKGGLLVDIGVQGFMPASQAERRFTNDLKHLVGQVVRLKLLEVDREKRRAIVSRKAVLDLEAEVARQAFWDRVSEGDIISGVIRRLTDFGAFVDLGGVDGLLHISDMAYHRVNKPSDIVSIGDEVVLRVLKMNPETSKVSLGLKQMQPKPWEALSQELQQGDIVEGTVVRITPWGAFVNVRPGIDGLIHISELDNHRVDKVDDIVQIGDTVQVAVLSINPEKERLSLSLKALKPVYEQEEDYLEYMEDDGTHTESIEEIVDRIEDEVDAVITTFEAADEPEVTEEETEEESEVEDEEAAEEDEDSDEDDEDEDDSPEE